MSRWYPHEVWEAEPGRWAWMALEVLGYDADGAVVGERYVEKMVGFACEEDAFRSMLRHRGNPGSTSGSYEPGEIPEEERARLNAVKEHDWGRV